MAGKILGVDIDRDTVLYRTIRKDRLLGIFKNHENALARPKLWDDTFENFALNSEIDLNGEIGTFGFKDDIYGQCWTLQSFSDAMWRIYSDGTDGIRVSTTAGKLIDSLSASEAKFCSTSCFIGKVRYCKDEELNEFAETQFIDGLDSDGVKIAETMLVKRNAFIHEREVRLIYLSPDARPANQDLYFYQFNPHDIIDQIMVHPQLSEPEANKLKSEIRKETSYKGELLHSLLYRLPTGFRFKVRG